MPKDIETPHIYDEWSGLFCGPDRFYSGVKDPPDPFTALKTANISAHNFLSNPIDENFDPHLLDENAKMSQGNIESTTYLMLAGTHVGPIPNHYAENWVRMGKLVALVPVTYGILSPIHAMRLGSAEQNDVTDRLWTELDRA